MERECQWLPQRILPTKNIWNVEEYKKYEDNLYNIFQNQIYGKIKPYNGKEVRMKRYPLICDRQESFYHIIGGKQFNVDVERASRILWGKAMIENEPCKYDLSICKCSGLLVWDSDYRGSSRRKIFFKEKRYIVILEDRPKYWLYITSYYINNSHKMRALTKEYHEATKNALHT